ncbi:probable helicase senataxin [Stegodyphus dumicola]|uniref:probable helicase senataxin n=1 Tax=Stegodyphus dumicola TaxID=202533 RepID=UPI0015AE575A|nr:probable helicase senataxin [Stegodyphus dumicola]
MNLQYILRQVEPGLANPLIINLNEEEVFIGGQMIPELIMYDRVSRVHAYIKKRGNEFFVRDLGSLNGVYVNGIKIGEDLHKLEIGDLIGFGVPSFNDGGFVCTFSAKVVSSIALKHRHCAVEDTECNPVKKIKQEIIIPENDGIEVVLENKSFINSILDEKKVLELENLEVVESKPVKIKREILETKDTVSEDNFKNTSVSSPDEHIFNKNIPSNYEILGMDYDPSSAFVNSTLLNKGESKIHFSSDTQILDQTAKSSCPVRISNSLQQHQIELFKNTENLQNNKNELYLSGSSWDLPGTESELVEISKVSCFTKETDFVKRNNLLMVETETALIKPLHHIHDKRKIISSDAEEIICISNDDEIISAVNFKPLDDNSLPNFKQSHFDIPETESECTNKNFGDVCIKETNKPVLNTITANKNDLKRREVVKSCGKALLTEPLPMRYRNTKIRGKEEWFKEQNDYRKIHVKKKSNVRLIPSCKNTSDKSVKRNFVKSHNLISKDDQNNGMQQISELEISADCLSSETRSSHLISATVFKENSIETKVLSNKGASKPPSIAKRPENYGSRISNLVETMLNGKNVCARKTVVKNIKDQVAEKTNHSKEGQVTKTNMRSIQNESQDKTYVSLLQNMPINSITTNINKEDLNCEYKDLADGDKESKFSLFKNKINDCSNGFQGEANLTPSRNAFNSVTFDSTKRAEVHVKELQECEPDKCSNKIQNLSSVSGDLINMANRKTFKRRSALKDKSSGPKREAPINIKNSNNVQSECELSPSSVKLPVSSTSNNLNKANLKLSYRDNQEFKFALMGSSQLTKEACNSCISLSKTDLMPTTNTGTKTDNIFPCHGNSNSELNHHLSPAQTINFYSVLEEVLGFDVSSFINKVHESFPFGNIRSLPHSFESLDSYVSSFHAAILSEVWDLIFFESKRIQECRKSLRKFYISIVNVCGISNGMMELQCESVVNKLSFCPCEGFIILLNHKNETHDTYIIGYIDKQYNRTLNLQTLTPEWKHLHSKYLDEAIIVKFSVYIKILQTYPLCRKLMTANAVCRVKSKLSLADTFHCLYTSPLLKDILYPSEKAFFLSNPHMFPGKPPFSYSPKQAILAISDVIYNAAPDPKIIVLRTSYIDKTQTIVGLLQNLLSNNLLYNNSKIRVLITAPSNAAVDKIGWKLIEANEHCSSKSCFIKFVRFGHSKSMHHSLLPYSLDAKATRLYRETMQNKMECEKKELKVLQASVNELKQKQTNVADFNTELKLQLLTNQCEPMKQSFNLDDFGNQTAEKDYKLSILRDADVILSTLGSSTHPILMSAFGSHSEMCLTCCIVDEATDCSELEILQPLKLGFNKLVLFGNCNEKRRHSFHSGHPFERSMFERFNLFFQTYKRNPLFNVKKEN